MQVRIKAFVCLCLVASLTSCVTANEFAKKIGAPPQNAVELRNLQMRRFDTLDQRHMLLAATDTLQDLGYAVTESSPEIGIVAGSKQRDAEETGQVAGQIALVVLFAALGSSYTPVWDKSQSIHVTLVTTPVENSKQIEVRVSFDRYLTNNHGHEWRAELILDDKIYQEFFEKFSSSVFLEAHPI